MFSCQPAELVEPEKEPEPEEIISIRGKKVLFMSPFPAMNLYSINIDGTGQKKLFDRKEYQSIRYASLSPDGRKIAIDLQNRNTSV